MNKSPLPRAEVWHQIVEEQKSSGQTISAYCRQHGLTQGSFFAWKRRLGAASKRGEFVEVKTIGQARVCGIEVRLPGRRRLLVRRGFDPSLLTELIRVLEGLPPGGMA